MKLEDKYESFSLELKRSLGFSPGPAGFGLLFLLRNKEYEGILGF